ncbi:hypothetical protein N2601_29855 (plasmid) [Rhizobium sp. CB3060]|uniref:hypothetical protein n=1 Tax=Rhizobium sp. CB3060 TaxID=3138255 RepID=UPI0021A58D96|nr:hypothetical protein [Rhizobium tropici]UWU25653.1 hypothetical protein N2601_29855 [Rhizobium tropici]
MASALGPCWGARCRRSASPSRPVSPSQPCPALLGGVFLYLLDRPLRRSYIGEAPGLPDQPRRCGRVLRSRAVFPIIMVGLGGCTFGGLSSFQPSLAAAYKQDYLLFFIGSTSAAIIYR